MIQPDMDPKVFSPSSTAKIYLLLFLPVIGMPLGVLLIRIIRRVWNHFQPSNEFGEKEISEFHQKWRRGFSRLRFFMETSEFGRLWTIFQAVLALGACAMYIAETYMENPSENQLVVAFTATFVTLFIVDYTIQLLVAEDRLGYVLSFYAMVDLISIPPLLIPLLVSAHLQNPLVEFLMTLRVLRILKVYRFVIISATEVQTRLISLGLTFAILVYLSAAFVSALERYYLVANIPVTEASLVNFHDSLYFMVTSFTTVGYGDVQPTATPTRVLLMVMMVIYMVVLPVQISRVARTMDEQDSFRNAAYTANRKHPHIVITGHVSFSATISFLRELFNNSLENKNTRIVILTPLEPNEDFKALFRIPLFKDRVCFLVGSPLDPKDLYRAQMHSAKTCFIMRGPLESEAEEDVKVIMFSVAIKKVFPDLPVFAQVANAVEREGLISTVCDRIFCINDLKMTLMARACVAPGSLTLISNLIRSHKPPSSLKSTKPQWSSEYLQGSLSELGSFILPKKYAGYTFAQLAMELQNKYDATVIGYQPTNSTSDFGSDIQDDGPQHSVRLNPPGNQVLAEGEAIFALLNKPLSFVEAQKKQQKQQKMKNKLSFFRSVVASASENAELLEEEENDENMSEDIIPMSKSGISLATARFPQSHPLPFEDNTFGSPYKTNNFPVEMREAIIEEVKFSGHVIVCGFSSSLHLFVATLRLKTLRNHPKVVVITKELPSLETWKLFSRFADVFVIKGDANLPSCLVAAGVKTCSRVVVATKDSQRGLEADAQAILIGKTLQGELKDLITILEMSEETNIEYLSPPDLAWQTRVNRTRELLNNNLISHEKRIKLLNSGKRANQEFLEREDLMGSQQKSKGFHTGELRAEVFNVPPNHHPHFAAGGVFLSSLGEAIMCQEYYRPYISEVIRQMISGEGSGQLFRIDIPQRMIGRRYGDLFRSQIVRNVLPLGLYRSQGFEGGLPYVFTNCPRDTVLKEKDKVFVMAASEPEPEQELDQDFDQPGPEVANPEQPQQN